VIFNSYVKLPEGIYRKPSICWSFSHVSKPLSLGISHLLKMAASERLQRLSSGDHCGASAARPMPPMPRRRTTCLEDWVSRGWEIPIGSPVAFTGESMSTCGNHHFPHDFMGMTKKPSFEEHPQPSCATPGGRLRFLWLLQFV
jgi:hypothetical protein